MRKLHISHSMFLLAAAILTAAAQGVTRQRYTDPVEPKFGRLVRAEAWLKQTVRDVDGKDFGSVRDLALDLETGHVALAVVGDPKVGREECLVVPPRLLKEDGSQGLTLLRNANGARLPVAALEKSLDRGFAGERYQAFGEEPYWSLPQENDTDPKAEVQKWDGNYRLTLLSKMAGTMVVDRDAHPLGLLMGFSFSPESGRIAYAAVAIDEDGRDRLLAVPLDAFVVPSDESKPSSSTAEMKETNVELPTAWRIELSKEIVQDTPGFDARHWPTKLERGWVEYVHVRYGRSPLSGVRHTTKAKRDAEAARSGKVRQR